jgi:peptidoglycan/LPS O-acetylase OafA/YrhL
VQTAVADPQPATATSGRYRTDIEGLRAIAVGAVVGHHLGVPGFGGGFTGVDVFFVISGYLITGLLLRDLEAGRGISLREFYARRVRRLLPAATVVIAVTAVSSIFLLEPPLDRLGVDGDGRAAATFHSNERFASNDTDYWAADEPPSPYQQFWSLSVEEQYYVVWPALMIAAAVAAARLRRTRHAVLTAALAVIVGASFVVSVRGSTSSPIDAFFLLPSRAWELGIGALLALASARGARLPDSVAPGARAAGLVAVAATFVQYGSTTTWPGVHALVPVLGTVAVLWAGETHRSGVAFAGLSAAPMQLGGRLSYSIYLWHWPLVVYVLGHGGRDALDAPATEKAAVLVAALVLALASFHLIERPVRESRGLRTRPNATLGLGAGLIAVSIVATVVPSLSPPTLDAGTDADPAPTGVLQATDFVPANVQPSLADAGVIGAAGDDGTVSCPTLGDCSFGDPDADVRVVLAGDSHASHWTPALRAVAEARGWFAQQVSLPGCGALTPDDTSRTSDECRAWHERTWDAIVEAHPDLLVVSDRHGSRPARDRAGWEATVSAALGRVPVGVAVAVLSETPVAADRVPRCLSAHLREVARCEPAWPSPTIAATNQALSAVARAAGATFVDLTPLLCTDDRCPAIVGDVLVYRDSDHLTQPFALRQAEAFGDLLEAALVR